jgi:hypothetical protein
VRAPLSPLTRAQDRLGQVNRSAQSFGIDSRTLISESPTWIAPRGFAAEKCATASAVIGCLTKNVRNRPTLTLADARSMMAACKVELRAKAWTGSVAIADDAGSHSRHARLVYYQATVPLPMLVRN